MIRLTTALFLSLSLLPLSTHAAGPAVGPSPRVMAELAVDEALWQALDRDGAARIEVTLDLTEELAADLDHVAAEQGVHPAVFDIVMMSAGGPTKLDQAGDFHLLRIAASVPVVRQILAMKEVVAVRLDTEPPARTRSADKASSCIPTSTAACIGLEFNEVKTVYGGVTGKVAAVDFHPVTGIGDSATFWAYSSNNWEVLAKILDGCAINGHTWLFAAAAGTNTYSVSVKRLGQINLGTWTATNKPIVDTTLFQCQ